jgi:hypothetical protein
MLRLVLPALGLSLLVPATASAAPFGELPFRAVNGSATCLRATGTPGELVRQTKTAVQLLKATPAGLEPSTALPADSIADCAEVVTRPSGAGLVAFLSGVNVGEERSVRAYLREPGQPWGPIVAALPVDENVFDSEVAADASDRGDALVVNATSGLNDRIRVRAARRDPGAPFAVPQTLFSARSKAALAPVVHAGVSATGEAVVTWTVDHPESAERELWAAIAPAGAPFGAPKRIGKVDPATPYDLAVAPDGRALIVFASSKRLRAAERAPGAELGAATTLAGARDLLAVIPSVALRDDGGALVAWAGLGSGSVTGVVRERPGAFGAPITVSRGTTPNSASYRMLLRSLIALFGAFGGEFGLGNAGPDFRGGNPRALFTPDGRALLTWNETRDRGGIWGIAPRSAVVSLAGGAPATAVHGAGLRGADSTTPLLFADGTLGAAWTDNSADERHGRIHLVRDGAPGTPEPAAPRVRITVAGSSALKRAAPLKLRVTCDAACDVVAQVAGRFDAGDSISLPRAGAGRIELDPLVRPIVPLKPGPVRVLVRYGAPGVYSATARTSTFELRRQPSPPPPRVLGLSATRDGDEVIVRWRTDRPAKGSAFQVSGDPARGEPVNAMLDDDPPRTSFVTRATDARALRKVTVSVPGELLSESRSTTVRVKG